MSVRAGWWEVERGRSGDRMRSVRRQVLLSSVHTHSFRRRCARSPPHPAHFYPFRLRHRAGGVAAAPCLQQKPDFSGFALTCTLPLCVTSKPNNVGSLELAVGLVLEKTQGLRAPGDKRGSQTLISMC